MAASGKSKISMQMIADQLGVTKVSVSKALNNQPGVSSELKKKIIEMSRELGYYPVTRSGGSGSGVKRLDFFISKRFFLENDKFYTVIYYTIGKLCNENNIRLSLNIAGSADEADLVLPPSFYSDAPDGIFISGEMSRAYTDLIVGTGIPTVSIDYCRPDLLVDSVVVDNFYAGYEAALHLIKQGHSEIGFVGNPFYASNVMDRYLGYVKAMKMAGLPLCDSWVINNNDASGSYDTQYALPDTLPTAFICHCDMAAYHLINKLHSQGVAVPGRVSLISFDNTDLGKSCTPALTTVDIDKVKMANIAFKQMMTRLANKDAGPCRIVIHADLLQRSSVSSIAPATN